MQGNRSVVLFGERGPAAGGVRSWSRHPVRHPCESIQAGDDGTVTINFGGYPSLPNHIHRSITAEPHHCFQSFIRYSQCSDKSCAPAG
jgi:hypothetical protein